MNETWNLICGSWSDALVSYNNICKSLDEQNIEKTNIVYYGLDRELSKFIKKQNRVEKMSRLDISEPASFFKYAMLAKADFSEWMKITELDKHLPNLTSPNSYEFDKNVPMVLPDATTDMSAIISSHAPYILVQPFSCYSCTFDKHWPHWVEAVNWMLENIDGKIVMVGQLTSITDPTFKFPWIDHPKLVNLVGQTESMVDVFHLMAGANGLVSTSNSLAIWSLLTNKPALIVSNQIVNDRKYFCEAINQEANTVVSSTIDLAAFEILFRNWFPLIGASPSTAS